MEDLIMSDSDFFEKALQGMPILPPKTSIAFRCRDCECVWTFGIETPISFERFYQNNKECLSCGKTNIEIDIVSVTPPPIYQD
jgi:hypothetical protein